MAQLVARPGTAAAKAKGRQVTIQRSFEPSFSIEPLAHPIAGRSGDVVPFRFKVESFKREARIEVAAIGLRQELNGQILHDEQSEKTNSIRLITPATMTLPADTPVSIEGVVKIPGGNAKFYTFGLLVRDLGTGDAIESKLNADGSRQTQAGVRFVTQYVLRLDVSVTGVRGEDGRKLVIEDVKLAPREGRPKFQATVLNSTDTAFEFELRGRLRSSPSDRSMKSLRMVMPVRGGVADEARYIGRILPKSRIHMEEMLPEAIAGGRYEADMELMFDGQVVVKRTLPLDVNALDFPAQEVVIAQVDEGLQVSPAQIELSQAPGGSRRITMLLRNRSKETKSITLRPLSESDLEIQAVMIQPSELQLPPEGSRKISLTLRSQPQDQRQVEYGRLVVTATSSGRDYEVARELPLAVILGRLPRPSVSLAPLQWDPSAPYPGFRVNVANSGTAHLALESRLTILDEYGRRQSIAGGFGKWLMPGATSQLEFRLDRPLAPGRYLIRCELQTPSQPLEIEQEFVVTDLESAGTEAN